MSYCNSKYTAFRELSNIDFVGKIIFEGLLVFPVGLIVLEGANR